MNDRTFPKIPAREEKAATATVYISLRSDLRVCLQALIIKNIFLYTGRCFSLSDSWVLFLATECIIFNSCHEQSQSNLILSCPRPQKYIINVGHQGSTITLRPLKADRVET